MNSLFIILVLLCFFILIVGLIKPSALAKKGEAAPTRKKVLKIMVPLIIIFFILVGVTTDDSTRQAIEQQQQAKQAEKLVQEESKKVEETAVQQQKIAEQQQAFTSWNTEVEKDLKAFDNIWSLWKTTLDGTSKGTVSNYQAYENMKKVSNGMRNISSKFEKTQIPTQLSKAHQETLKNGLDKLSSTAIYRQMAAEKMQSMIDTNDFKPSNVDQIKTFIDSGDADMLAGAFHITSVKNELGLIEKQ